MKLAAGDVGLPVGIIAVFHGVGQVGVDLLLGCHLRLGLGQVALGGQNLLAQVQQPGGGADKQGQYHQLGQEGRFFGFHRRYLLPTRGGPSGVAHPFPWISALFYTTFADNGRTFLRFFRFFYTASGETLPVV